METSPDSNLEKFYAERFATPTPLTNERLLQKIEESIESDDDYDDRHRYDDSSGGEYHKTTTIGIPGVDGLDVEIEVDYTIYHGTGAADDPSSVNFINVLVTDDVFMADIENPLPDERAVIGLIHQAVMKVAPNTPQHVLIPKGLDVLKFNDALDGLLNDNLKDLEDEIYERRNY